MVSTHYTHNYECDFRNYLFLNPFEDVIWNLVQPFEQLYCDERSLFEEQEEKKEKEEEQKIDEKKDDKEAKEAPVITAAITNPEFFELLDELETCPDLTTSNEKDLSNQVKNIMSVSPEASSSLIKNTLEHKRNIPSATPNDEACNIFKTSLMPTYVENTLMDSVSMQLQFEHSYSKSANSERNSNNNETMSLSNQHEKSDLKSEMKDNCQRELIIRSQMAISILKKHGSKILNNIVQSSTNCSSATNEVQNTENMEKENVIVQNAHDAEKQNIIIQNTQDTEKIKIDPCRKKINIEEYRRRNNKENLFLTEKEKREENTKIEKESCGRPSRSRSKSRNKESRNRSSKNRSRSKRSRSRSRSRTKNKSSERNSSRSRSRSKRMSRSRSNSRRISRSKSRNRRMNRSRSRSRNRNRNRSTGRRSRSNSRNRRSRNRSRSRGRRRRSRYESSSRDRSRSNSRSHRTRNNSLRSSVSSYNSSTSPTTSSYIQSRSSSRSSGSPQYYSSSRLSPSCYKRREEIERNSSVERDKTIHVGHLDERTSERDLRKIFENFGEIRQVRIHSTNSNRYGFVTFWHRNDAFRVWDKKEHPLLEKYNIGFGGRRDFCLSEYSDLDDMKRNISFIRMSEGSMKRDFMDDLEEFKAIAQKKRKV